MATSLSRRWLFGALILFAVPLSALAQTAVIDVTPNAPVDGVAGTTFPSAGVGFQNTSGGTLTNVEIQVDPLPAGVTWNTASCVGGIDVTNLATTGIVTIATIDDAALEVFVCDLDAAPDVADGTVFTVTAFWTTDTGVADTSSDITIAREFDLGLSVVDAPDPVVAGSGAGNLTHTFTLSRSGPSDAAGVQVDLIPSLPAGVALDSAVPTVGSIVGTTWTVGDWAASENGNDQTLTLTLTVDSTATDCTDCISATGTVSAASGTDTNPANDTAVDPTSIETAASVPSGFMTTVAFTNGYNGTVGVTISCNNGLPLTQSKDISAASGVNFIVTSLDFIAPDTECDISVDVASGYTASVLANGVDTGSSCLFSASPEAGEAGFDFSRANTCAITAAPVQSQFVVTKDWVTYDDGNTEQTGSLHVWCAPASIDTGNQFGTVEDTFVLNGDGTFYLDFYPSPAGATCYAEEDVDSSAVESSSSCAGGVAFAVGDTVKTCAITNTVFYEGIPTLSQYGLAVLVLLMLGVGFVGIRRFA